MPEVFLGLSPAIWGCLCFAVGTLWFFVWPRNKASPSAAIRFFILRWFHSLTWWLLALTAFVGHFGWLGGALTAQIIALLSLVVYLSFLGALVTSKRVPPNRRACSTRRAVGSSADVE